MKSYKKTLGILAILVGFIALVTPFTPGALWLIFIGFQLLGIHFIYLDRLERYFGFFSNGNKTEKTGP